MKTTTTLGALALAVLAASGTANAATFEALDGVAKAEITATPNGGNTDVTIKLTNLNTADEIQSAADTLTGISFAGIGTFTLISGISDSQFNFSSQKVGVVSTTDLDLSWAITGQGLYFDGFGSGGSPIIGGPATGGTNYNNANPSLTAGPHGKYGYIDGNFVLTVPGAFNPDDLAKVTFLFNTDGTVTHDSGGCIDCGGDVPEPASLSIIGLGAAGLLLRRRKVA